MYIYLVIGTWRPGCLTAKTGVANRGRETHARGKECFTKKHGIILYKTVQKADHKILT